MSRLRVAFVTTGLGTGGAEHMLCKLVEEAAAVQIALMVVSLRDEGAFGARIRDAGAELVCCNLHRPLGVLDLIRALCALRAFSPMVLQGWMYHGSLAATLFRFCLPGAPSVFWSMRQTLYALREEPLITRIIIRALAVFSRNSVQSVIYNSTLSMEQHRAVGICSPSARMIPNGFDLCRYQPDADRRRMARERLGYQSKELVIGLVARVHPMKDHDNFINAASMVLSAMPEVRVVLAGEGTDTPLMREKILQAGLAEVAHCMGRVSNTEELYPALDLLVLASAWGEAWPNVLGEAMACGVPCVATDVGESGEIVGDTGRIVPARDPASLARACVDLLQLSSSERAILGTRARVRVVNCFDIRSVFKQYTDIWRGDDLPGKIRT